jgi:hypothetical protein
MYNMYPIFYALASNRKFRDGLLTRCYDTIRLIEQDFHSIEPIVTERDELGLALNGSFDIEVPIVNDWYRNRGDWKFSV